MQRTLTLALVIAGTLVATATAAWAKGAGEVVISGPGFKGFAIASGMPMDGAEGPFWDFMSQVGVFDEQRANERPPGPLGPAYAMEISVSPLDGRGRPDLKRTDQVTAYLFPYAEGEPWTYVPSSVETRDFGTIEGGWVAASQHVVEELRSKGLPATSPVPLESPSAAPLLAPTSRPVRPAAGRAAARTPTHGAFPAWPWVIGLAGAVAVPGIAAGVLAVRPRRGARRRPGRRVGPDTYPSKGDDRGEDVS
jgi:hypothetical protein